MDKPYAGIYDTFMLPNSNPDKEVRLAELIKAIKMVYASTYKHTAQAYPALAFFLLLLIVPFIIFLSCSEDYI